jgi:hypothetical protein
MMVAGAWKVLLVVCCCASPLLVDAVVETTLGVSQITILTICLTQPPHVITYREMMVEHHNCW